MAGIGAGIATEVENAATEGAHNIFFIIGAPTKLTFSEFEKFCIKYGKEEGDAKNKNVKLAICADIDTHKKALACENVFKTPTNFRAHGDDKGHAFLTMDDEDTKVEKSLNTLEDFKKLQQDTAESIYDILKYARENKIHTYFASVPRELRPILLHKELGNKDDQIKMIEDKFGKVGEDGSIELSKDGIRLKNILEEIHKKEDKKDGDIYPHIISGPYILEKYDHDLTLRIYNKIKEKGKFKDLIKNINNIKISKHGATFLADVITVGCALLIGDPTVWKHYDIIFGEDKGETKTKSKKYSGNSYFKFGDQIHDVEQENISYRETKSESSLFHGFNAEKALTILTGKMTEALELENIWGNCYVWHDAELNDVDDEPAITLIEQLSGEGKVELCKSYEPVGSTGGGYKKSYGKKKKTKKTRRKTKNMRRKSKSKSKTKTKKKSTRKKKHYKKRKSNTHKKR